MATNLLLAPSETEESEFSSADALPQKLDTEENRICAVFGHPRSGPPPKVTHDSLERYRDYLATRLSFPFQALYMETEPRAARSVRYVKVLGLSKRIRNRLWCVVHDGGRRVELPLAEISVFESHPSFQLLDDYNYWSFHWR